MSNTGAPVPNIWESLLKESSKRVQLPDGAVLFMGNASCGKTALVSHMCADSDGPAEEDVPKIPDITAYDSFIASDMDEVSDNFSTSRVGIWSVSEKSFKGAAGLVLQPSRIERLVIMIGIDLSKPMECREELIRWLKYLRFQLESNYFAGLSETDVVAKKKQVTSYISSVREQNNMNEMQDLLHNYGIPLVVVGCKSDAAAVRDLADLKINAEAQKDIRHICSRVGAAFIYTSAKTGQNCAVLKKYILHRLYHELIPMSLVIEHSSSELFVPAGLDSDDLIDGVSSESPLVKLELSDVVALEDPFSGVVVKKGNNVGEELVGETDVLPTVLEEEQGWLANLHTEIEQAASQSGPSLLGPGSSSFDPAALMAAGVGAEKQMSAADKILAAGMAGADAGGDAKPTSKPSRRHSTMTQNTGAKKAAPEDVKGFFESLMK